MKKILETLKTWKFWKELIIMTLGMLVGAAAVNYFLVPSKIIIGSISGLSIVLAAVFEGIGISIKVSTVIVIINAILLVLAYILIGSEFGLKTYDYYLRDNRLFRAWPDLDNERSMVRPPMFRPIVKHFSINTFQYQCLDRRTGHPWKDSQQILSS